MLKSEQQARQLHKAVLICNCHTNIFTQNHKEVLMYNEVSDPAKCIHISVKLFSRIILFLYSVQIIYTILIKSNSVSPFFIDVQHCYIILVSEDFTAKTTIDILLLEK